MSVIPVDLTPYITGYPVVSTRRIFGQWIYTDGTGVEVPPTITYMGGPYYIDTTKVTVFPKQQIAVTLAATTEGTTGLWYADVLVSDDPDLIGDVAIRISHPILPGGSITVVVPAGSEPLNIANAARVTGTPGGLVAVAGLSAYEIAVANGFVGTEEEWLTSLGGGGGGVTTETIQDTVNSLIVAGTGITKSYNDTANTLTIAATGTVLDTEAVQDIVAAFIVAGTNVTRTYDDAGGTLTISATGGSGGGGLTAEEVRDTIGTALLGSGLITVTVNDAGDTITISTTATANQTDTFLRDRTNHTGNMSADNVIDGTVNHVFTIADDLKLNDLPTNASLTTSLSQRVFKPTFTPEMKIYITVKQNSDGTYDARPSDLATYEAIEWVGTTVSPYALAGDRWLETAVIPV